MKTARRILLSLLAGAGFGAVLALLFAPSILEWYAQPAVKTSCDCSPSVSWALDNFRLSMGVTALVFAVLATIGFEIFFRVRRSSGPRSAV